MKKNEIQSNKKNENKRKIINLSLVVFAISIVVFTVIGALVLDNFSHLQQVEELTTVEDDTYKGEIDDRLRFIAMQDDDKISLKETEEIPAEEVVNEPEEIAAFLENDEIKKTKFTEYNEKFRKKDSTETDINNTQNAEEEINLDDIPYKKEVPVVSPLNMKVVIGDFDSKEAAMAELEQVRSQFTAPPFIKVINGRYAIQVAAFKTPDTAYEFVNSLRQQGFSARIIEE